MLVRAVGVAAAMFALALTAGLAWFVYHTPGAVFSSESEHAIASPKIAGQPEPVIITVRKGESARDIGQSLADARIVRSRRLFEVLVGVLGVQDQLQAGDYEFDPGIPAVEVVRRIAEGRTASRQVTIPEGLRAEEIGDILEKQGVVPKQAFLDALVKSRYDAPFLADVESTSLEGFLFPATYDFNRQTDAQQVVQRLLQGFQDNVADKIQLEGQDLTLEQVVTLASIVEREAAVPSERPIIASVFLNRLRAGIPLQADPTVQYAIAQQPDSVRQYGYWKEALTEDDLQYDSPYNTYRNPGLPPGPIANPGVDSIQAVIRPARTNYLFFVAKNDGTHVFAETLEEHLRNVQQYQGQEP
jgi:UPF0755 protein